MLLHSLTINSLNPIKFYPYTSCVTHRIFSQSRNYKNAEHSFLETLGDQLQALVESKNIYWDNKVVIECEFITNPKIKNSYHSNIFIGCYDGSWSVGLGVRCDEWINPIIIK